MSAHRIAKHVLKISRKCIQGGFSNEQYPEKFLRDYRLLHHYPSLAICAKFGCRLNNNDSKFYDAINERDEKAEGKTCANGVTFTPSRDTGANRAFNADNLEQCFTINSYYFLYEVSKIDREYVTFDIYWVPISIIRSWYEQFGNKHGRITKTNWVKCLSQCEFEQTEEIRD
jgi:hypothetical protein